MPLAPATWPDGVITSGVAGSAKEPVDEGGAGAAVSRAHEWTAAGEGRGAGEGREGVRLELWPLAFGSVER